MFEYFNKLVKKLSWVDMKLVGFVGIGLGLLLARIDWFSNLNWVLIVGLIVLAYAKIVYSIFVKEQNKTQQVGKIIKIK